MSIKDRMKRIEKKHRPADNALQVLLPDWLQGDDYQEPVAEGRVITPRGYMALQPDGGIKWHE